MTESGLPGGDARLVLRFGGSLVEQLGAQLYPSVTATVAELLSNAWDAEAKNVWVSMPFGTWGAHSEIAVTDDGHGMTREEAQRAYLIVGRKRRAIGGEMSQNGLRRVHGRKGIGKLAAFGTAGVLECSTVKDREPTAFRLDYERIRQLEPSEDYEVEDADDSSPPVNPETGDPLEHGTRIRLTRLLQKRALGEEQFRQSMSRRFAISAEEMKVCINDLALTRFDMTLQFRFPRDGVPEDATVDGGWATEVIAGGHRVRWWIGFTDKPLEDETLQGISILANQKMAQRPFLFERSKGTEGQLGQEYLVGEVEADWIDTGVDVSDDLIQSNRDQLQLEDDRLTAFVEWGRRRLAWALRERNQLRADQAIATFEASPELLALFEPFTKAETKQFTKMAVHASKLDEMTGEGLVELMRNVIDSRSDLAVRQLIEEIEASDEAVQPRMWELVRQFGLIDARRTFSIIEARLSTIRKLKYAIREGAPEVPEIHNIIRGDPWLLDPRWHYLDDEVDMTKFGVEFEPALDEETGHRLDFMFAFVPRPPATKDEVIVVEIKRGTDSKGRVRRATEAEVNKFHAYVLDVETHEGRSSNPPRVRGLMIAQDYTDAGDRMRKSLERLGGGTTLEFKTWERVIDETERMHIGWLEVSRLRGLESGTAEGTTVVVSQPVPEAGTAAAATTVPAAVERATTDLSGAGVATVVRRTSRARPLK